ncbi:F-box domain-containing protein [Cadophora sp. MPI-SDFR-AT-0126]|nr:F-box domain-containing protein [Leotiomycetes sp. MPI-SDFR-AT-0126]
MASPIACPTPEPIPADQAVPKKKLNFDDLPLETKKEIFKHASSPDLIALSLVSKHFRDLAAERIYRSFHILFPDEDDPSNDYPFDSLAGGLETFVTSDYNYAQYLKELIMETQSGGIKGEMAYRAYLNELSCGKFMNTLLLLTLRQAKSLERFQWDIRVELSRPVWRELHKIKALKHFHVRMQSGPTTYQPLPPLPNAILPPAPGEVDSTVPGSILHPLPPILPVPAGSPNSFPFGNQIAKIYLQPPGGKVEVKAPPTLRGFKDLKTLTVLDMDSLDYLDELKECIRDSSSTLSSLKLSFSDALINRSRKPQPDPQSDDDSDQEDEFGQLIPPPGLPPPNPPIAAHPDPFGPSKTLKAQEEKKNQEAALAKILGCESPAPKPKPQTPVALKEEVEKTRPEEDPKRRFIRNLAPVAAKLMGHVKQGGDVSVEGKETLAMIEKAAQMYLDATEEEKKPDKAAASDESSTAKATPASSSASTDGVEDAAIMTGPVASEPGLFDEPPKKKAKDGPDVSNPEDIDVEEPEGNELAVESEVPSAEVVPDESVVTEAALSETDQDVTDDAAQEANRKAEDAAKDAAIAANFDLERREFLEVIDQHNELVSSVVAMEQEGDMWAKKVEEFSSHLQSGNTITETDRQMIAQAKAAIKTVSERVVQLTAGMSYVTEHISELKELSRDGTGIRSAMSEYVRSTRGLTLDTLSIYMIPTKASVLARGVDINALQSITLLNVGAQSPIWNMLARENKLSPLPLHKIHTDNVTLPFLLCLSQLEKLTELVMMERTSKDRVEGNALKSTVTIEQIRKMVLKKHAPTLKVLVVRNDTISMEWGFNIKTAVLLCERAKNLEELGCSFGVRTMHTLMQYMSGLTALRVLHVISFHNPEDTCTWVMREFRKFAVDVICHNPSMKLEYLALDQALDRLVRRKPMLKPKVDKKGKGKEANWTSAKALAELVMGSAAISTSGGWNEESKYDFPDSSDDEDGIVKTGLRVETIDGIRFSDVLGVRIFERDILTGKL